MTNGLERTAITPRLTSDRAARRSSCWIQQTSETSDIKAGISNSLRFHFVGTIFVGMIFLQSPSLSRWNSEQEALVEKSNAGRACGPSTSFPITITPILRRATLANLGTPLSKKKTMSAEGFNSLMDAMFKAFSYEQSQKQLFCNTSRCTQVHLVCRSADQSTISGGYLEILRCMKRTSVHRDIQCQPIHFRLQTLLAQTMQVVLLIRRQRFPRTLNSELSNNILAWASQLPWHFVLHALRFLFY
mmetsp:Transcript_38748/g.99478  ORF Transcript_38748/g.99478 Transcript_38748/m.99478 type:complete len:245 (-) Transcript_38748:273-1007(-)